MEEAKNRPGKDGAPPNEKEVAHRAQVLYAQMRDAAAADNTSRQRASVFALAARNATTPEQVEAVRERASQSGYSLEEMARLDSRFTPRRPSGAQQSPAAPANMASSRGASAPPAPAAAAAPIDDAGARLDAARANLQAMRSRPAPGLAAGRAAIDQYAAQVQQARAEVARAEAEYRSTVPQSGPAFVTPR
jgi:hypothetical protein